MRNRVILSTLALCWGACMIVTAATVSGAEGVPSTQNGTWNIPFQTIIAIEGFLYKKEQAASASNDYGKYMERLIQGLNDIKNNPKNASNERVQTIVRYMVERIRSYVAKHAPANTPNRMQSRVAVAPDNAIARAVAAANGGNAQTTGTAAQGTTQQAASQTATTCQGTSTISLKCGTDTYARYGWDGQAGAHWCKNGTQTHTLPNGGNFTAAGCSVISGSFTQGTTNAALGNATSGGSAAQGQGGTNPAVTQTWQATPGDCHFGGKLFYPTRSGNGGVPNFSPSQAALIGQSNASGAGKYVPNGPSIVTHSAIFGIASNAFVEISPQWSSQVNAFVQSQGGVLDLFGHVDSEQVRQQVLSCWLKEYENDPSASDINGKNILTTIANGTTADYVPDPRVNNGIANNFGCFGFIQEKYQCKGYIIRDANWWDGQNLHTGNWNYDGEIVKFDNGSICSKGAIGVASDSWRDVAVWGTLPNGELKWDRSTLTNPSICTRTK